jgi:hypothetical protein
MRKKLIITVLFLLSSIPSAFACGNFVIYSHEGPGGVFLVPVQLYAQNYYTLFIDSSAYPSDQKLILYNLTVDNKDVAMTLNFNPSNDLLNYFYGSSFYIDAHTRKDVGMNVYVDGPTKFGSVSVTGSCSGGFPEGSFYLMLIGRGNPAPPACLNLVSSCGVFPNCNDLTKMNGCYSGYYRNYYCSNNVPKYSEQCTPYCCGLIGGTCPNAATCFTGSSTTTTTTTTTTLPSSTTTTTIPTGTSGCYNGLYRNYYFSGGQLTYSEMCTPYCCGLIGGMCQGSMCPADPPTTTTTVPTTTTTVPTTTSTTTVSTTTTTTIPSGTTTTTTTLPTTTTVPSTCTYAYALSLSGCNNGYYRYYYCSGNQLQYSEICSNYCCSKIGGTCQGPTCSGSVTTTTTTLPSSTTTTTLPSSTCTYAYALSLSGCDNGYYKYYYCSNSHLEYSQLCTPYCCKLINKNCQGSSCVA